MTIKFELPTVTFTTATSGDDKCSRRIPLNWLPLMYTAALVLLLFELRENGEFNSVVSLRFSGGSFTEIIAFSNFLRFLPKISQAFVLFPRLM